MIAPLHQFVRVVAAGGYFVGPLQAGDVAYVYSEHIYGLAPSLLGHVGVFEDVILDEVAALVEEVEADRLLGGVFVGGKVAGEAVEPVHLAGAFVDPAHALEAFECVGQLRLVGDGHGEVGRQVACAVQTHSEQFLLALALAGLLPRRTQFLVETVEGNAFDGHHLAQIRHLVPQGECEEEHQVALEGEAFLEVDILLEELYEGLEVEVGLEARDGVDDSLPESQHTSGVGGDAVGVIIGDGNHQAA